MEVLHPNCVGLDVHKKTVVACALTTEPNGRLRKQIRTFGTMTAELLALGDWLQTLGVRTVAMESTGEFWKPVYNLLEGRFELLVVNAQHIKNVPGRKTDVKDAEWIADLLRHGLLRGSFIPERPQRALRDLTRQRSNLVQDRASVINRLHKALEWANIKLTSVVSDVTGVSARAMLEALVAGQHDPATLADLAEGRLRSKRDLLEQALTGVVQEHQRFIIAEHLIQLDNLDEQIGRFDAQIEAYLARLSNPPANDEAPAAPTTDTPTEAPATPTAEASKAAPATPAATPATVAPATPAANAPKAAPATSAADTPTDAPATPAATAPSDAPATPAAEASTTVSATSAADAPKAAPATPATDLTWQAAIALADTIPGIGPRLAQDILAETGIDMTRFPTAGHLAAWAKLCPGNRRSGGKRLSAATGHGNRHLRAKLVQAAWAAIKVKKSYFAACFQRLAGRRGAKRAIIAIAHRILIALYHMLKQRKPFEDLGATYYDERHQAQLIKRTERRFAQLGLKITVEPLPAA